MMRIGKVVGLLSNTYFIFIYDTSFSSGFSLGVSIDDLVVMSPPHLLLCG